MKVLFLAGLPFNSHIQVGEQKYAKLFKKEGFEVFYLSHYIHPFKFIKINSRNKKLFKYWYKGVNKNKEGILCYSPFCYLPYVNLPILDNINLANSCLNFSFPNLKKILKKNSFINIDILFINNISAISVLNFVKPKLIIFRLSDRIEKFENVPDTMSLLKEKIIKISDLIFVTSKNLEKETKVNNRNVYYLPNGICKDFIFNRKKNYYFPKEYKNISKPIVIYIGAIRSHFDFETFEYGLSKLRNISFVLIGPVGSNCLSIIKKFKKKYSNFYYLGPKYHKELEIYLFFSEVGIIPFKINSLTNEINPVKFFEYAGYGLPVVSSDMLELKNYKKYVFFYKNKEEYIDLIKDTIDMKSIRLRMINFASENTWEERFKFMLSKIKELL